MPTFTGDNGNNRLVGGSGDDTLVGLGGSDTLDGAAGNDVMRGGAGDDYLLVDSAADRAIESIGEGYDTVFTTISFSIEGGSEIEALRLADPSSTAAFNLTGNEFGQILAGGAGANVLTGGGGDDYLEGRGGVDTLDGGSGNDVLRGGTEGDYYLVDSASDRVLEAIGEGYDTLFAAVSFTLESGAEIEAVRLTDASSTAAFNLTGNEFGQILAGGAGANVLRGGGGDDYLEGRGGNDTLDGGVGSDILRGGTGDDFYLLDAASDRALEAVGEGFDTAFTTVGFALEAGSQIEALRLSDAASVAAVNLAGNEFGQILSGGAGANVLNGGGGDDYLEGRGGVDTLDGGTGNDVLRGGTDNDYYLIDSALDRALETAGEGHDTAFTAVSFLLEAGSEVEELRLTDASSVAALNLTGNEFGQILAGGAGANVLNGGGGDDYLEGRGGNDTLDGDTGNDIMRGGSGDDFYLIDAALDRALEAGGEGYDTAFASTSFALEAGSQIEALRLTDPASLAAVNLAGNEIGQILAGGAGANRLDGGGGDDYLEGRGGMDTLDGGTGNDVLRGGTGDDFYVVDSGLDRVLEVAGEGYDTAFTAVSFALEAGSEVEELRLVDAAGVAAINLTGNEYGQILVGGAGANALIGGGGIDNLFGQGGNDRIDGGAGADTLNGEAGDDTLEGGLGNDVLAGGAGADRFVFSTALSQNVDTISDFDINEDRIVLNGDAGSPFAGLATGTLFYNSDPYAGATGPSPGGSRFLYESRTASIYYDSPTGSVYFDADGAGGQAMVLFARVTPGTNLSSAHFTVEGAPNRSPSITSSNTATVLEHAPTSTIVYQIQAIDPDGDNLDFLIGGADQQFVTVDAIGAVRLTMASDLAVRSSYNFTVSVRESNGEQVSKSVTLAVARDPNATPYVISESGDNDARAQAMPLDRALFRVTTNSNLVNDTLPSANINGSISSSTDKDFFSVTLNAGEQIILDIDGTTRLDSMVRLFDANGTELVSNDDLGSFDAGSTAHAGISHNMDSLIKFRVPTSGTYFFSVEAFDPTSADANSGAYTLNVSIGPRASAAQLIEEDIQSLLSGDSWSSPDLTFGFPTSVGQYLTGQAVDERGSFQPLLSAQQTAVRQVLAHASNLTNLSFSENSTSPGSAQLRYARTTDGATAHAYYPGDGDGGDSWYNSANGNYDNPVVGNYAWTTFLHETGHALGLKHGHESPSLSPLRNSLEYSVMTYSSYTGGSTVEGSGYSNEAYGYPQTYMMFDIAALQRLYGADFGTNSGNSVYSWDPNSGAFLINGVSQWTPGANRVFMTLWDGGGIDTYDLSSYSGVGGVSIDLRPGEWSRISNIQLANLGDGHFAVGNIANALQYNDDARSLVENAIGTSDNDVLTGNNAVNRLTGSGGADVFRFFSVAQSSVAAPDTITDFSADDRLSFSTLDANPATEARDSFYYLHDAAFTGQPGQLRHERVGSDVIVSADIDGDGIADFQVILQNGPDLFATHFYL